MRKNKMNEMDEFKLYDEISVAMSLGLYDRCQSLGLLAHPSTPELDLRIIQEIYDCTSNLFRSINGNMSLETLENILATYPEAKNRFDYLQERIQEKLQQHILFKFVLPQINLPQKNYETAYNQNESHSKEYDEEYTETCSQGDGLHILVRRVRRVRV
jgi:hypothetical protein